MDHSEIRMSRSFLSLINGGKVIFNNSLQQKQKNAFTCNLS